MAPHEADRPLSIVTATTLFPNSARPSHGVFVKARLKKLLETGQVTSHVIAPVGWVPPGISYAGTGYLRDVPSHEVIDGIAVHHPRYLIVPKIGMTVTPFFLYHTFKKAIGTLLASGQNVDLIDAHYFYPDGVALQRVARDFGIPIVITARGTDLNLLPQYPGPRRMITRAAQAADGLITVCEALKTPLLKMGIPAARVTVLRNGVDLQFFQPVERDAARARFALTRRTLGSVGHLIKRKGHHHVIAALPQLEGTDLVIAGDGEEKAALQALAHRLGVAERVRFLGAIPQDSLRVLYGALDVLVLASSREGWANVLLEAMACGTPVVASAVWGTPEVVASPEAGMLMPSLDENGVVSAVRTLFENLPARAATRAYAEKFGWQPTTDGQLKLFRDIVGRGAV